MLVPPAARSQTWSPWVSVIGSGGTGLPGRLLPPLGAGYVGPSGGNASSCTLDTRVLIPAYFTVGLTRGRRNTLCSRSVLSNPHL